MPASEFDLGCREQPVAAACVGKAATSFPGGFGCGGRRGLAVLQWLRAGREANGVRYCVRDCVREVYAHVAGSVTASGLLGAAVSPSPAASPCMRTHPFSRSRKTRKNASEHASDADFSPGAARRGSVCSKGRHDGRLALLDGRTWRGPGGTTP